MVRVKERVSTSDIYQDKDVVGLYLHEISATPLLDAEGEIDLAKKIEAGVYAEHVLNNGGHPTATDSELKTVIREGEAAKERFICANLRLVVSVARKYVRSAMPMLDLIQEGNLGLMRAVEKFDWKRGYKFSTYATWWIRQSIMRSISQQDRVVRIPVHLVEIINKMNNAYKRLCLELGREPEDEEVAKEISVTVDQLTELRMVSQDVLSLDTPLGEDGDFTIGDMVSPLEDSVEEGVVSTINHDDVVSLVNRLDSIDLRMSEIIRCRYGIDDGRQRTLTEVAQKFDLSRERVRQLEIEALSRLRGLAKHSGVMP